MDKTFTLNSFSEFIQNEESYLMKAGLMPSKVEKAPKQSTVDNILNYSKALSVRDSKNHGKVEMVLN